LFSIISVAIDSLSAEDKTALCLRGFVKIDAAAYLAVPTPPTPHDLGLQSAN
jgi:hypothetical protein